MSAHDNLSAAQFYHGTRSDFEPGQMLTPQGRKAKNFADPNNVGQHVYFTGQLAGAAFYADMAKGGGSGRIYQVRPTGKYADDPTSLSETGTNPTKSFRTRKPVEVLREVQPHELVYDEKSRKIADTGAI